MGDNRTSVLELQILCRLSRGETHGWQMLKDFERAGVMVSGPSFYKIVKRLKLSEHLRATAVIVPQPAGGNDKVQYKLALTLDGRNALRDMMRHLCPCCSETGKGGMNADV